MRGVNAQLEQIQLLIDRAQHRFEQESDENKAICDKLLTLSERLDYSYGQALAHVHLARFFQMQRDEEHYAFHLERARQIAETKNYFDVLMGYYRLEGLSNAANSNEATALSFYLSGAKLAAEVKDKKREADFCCDIGNLFYSNSAYEDGERLYHKALSLLKDSTLQESVRLRRSVLIGLLHLACTQRALEKARTYRAQCEEAAVEGGNLALLLRAGDIRLLLLEGQEEARQSAALLVADMRRSSLQGRVSTNAYLVLMDLLLSLQDRDAAAWCMGELDAVAQNTSQNTALRVQKLRMRYAETFGLLDEAQYRRFYESTVGGARSRSQMTAESFKNLIALYETKKERARVTKALSDLETVVNTDELTQIYNRRYLGKLISKLTQDSRVTSLDCVMIDVDYFKEYNDHYGHPKGDEALVAVATLLQKHLPSDAYAARYGGDEFICLLANREEAATISFVTTVQTALRQENIAHTKSKHGDRLTLTFGIYHEPQPRNCSESDLLQKADLALYRAKERGRNTYAVYRKGEEYDGHHKQCEYAAGGGSS